MGLIRECGGKASIIYIDRYIYIDILYDIVVVVVVVVVAAAAVVVVVGTKDHGSHPECSGKASSKIEYNEIHIHRDTI